MKIGISVCTTPKRYNEIKDYTSFCEHKEVFFLVNNDISYNGAPSSRNYCIKKMMDVGCDYMFLFDDDCYPVMRGFDKYCVEQAIKHDVHFIGIPNIFKDKLISNEEELVFWNGCIGCFSFFTRKHIETIGYYNTAYQKYGFTDPPYTYRSKKSPLSKDQHHYASLLRLPSYIWSSDVYNLNPTVNYTQEEKEAFINNNREIFNQEIAKANLGFLYYPYSNKNENV